MDEYNKDDEKRRIMTPPPEWGGDDKSHETDWLNDAPQASSVEAEDGPSSALDNEVDWLGADAADEAPQNTSEEPSTSSKAVFTLPDDDTSDSGWLGNTDGTEPDTTAADTTVPESNNTPESPSAPWAADSNQAATGEESDTPTITASETSGDDAVVPPAAEPSPAELAEEAVRVRRVASKGRDVDPQAVAAESLLTDHQAVAQQSRRFPVWPIVTVTAAAILLIVGGWGAVQERNALQQEIAQLKRQLSQKRNEGDLTGSQEAALLAENESMKAQLATLRDEYAQLANEIGALQDRLMGTVGTNDDEQGMATANSESENAEGSTVALAPEPPVATEQSKEPAMTEPDINQAEPTDSVEQSSAAVMDTTWFVNVASHSSRELAATWRDRIAERYDGVRIQEAEVNGRTLFRVRVLGFKSKAAANNARQDLEQAFGIGPLWVGSMSTDTDDSSEAKLAVNEESPEQEQDVAPVVTAVSTTDSKTRTAQLTKSPVIQSETQQPLELRPMDENGGWFIYVDTFSQPSAADDRAKQIMKSGYDAKVAVEYRAGEMFYRVQVVGIKSRMQGEKVVAELATLGDMPNLQLRQY